MMDHTRECRKYDPQGNYVRRWLPVLARLPVQYIHTCAFHSAEPALCLSQGSGNLQQRRHFSSPTGACTQFQSHQSFSWLPAAGWLACHWDWVEPPAVLCRPWEAPAQVLAAAGVELGGNYERPIILPDESRQVCLPALPLCRAWGCYLAKHS